MASYVFPLNARRVKWNSEVVQQWDVTEQEAASGKRRAITSQTLPAWEFSIAFPALSAEEKDKLLAFYSQCKGSLIPFFYKDAENYKCENVALPQNTDGSFQLMANMHGQQEPIYYADNLTVYVDGEVYSAAGYTLDRGAVVFDTAIASTSKVTATYEYYWKVVFGKSKLTIKQKFNNLFECSLTLKVVR